MDPLTLLLLVVAGLGLWELNRPRASAPAAPAAPTPTPSGPSETALPSVDPMIGGPTPVMPNAPIAIPEPRSVLPPQIYVPPPAPPPPPPVSVPAMPADVITSISYADFLSQIQPQFLALTPTPNYPGAAMLMFRIGVEWSPLSSVLAGQSAPNRQPWIDYGTFINTWVPAAIAARQATGKGIGPGDAMIDWWRVFYGEDREGWTLNSMLQSLNPAAPVLNEPAHPTGAAPSGPGPSSGPAGLPLTSLPPAPGREALCRVKAAFNGDVTMTTEIGTYDSWGPEVTLLSASSRQATYAAHRAWGATHFVVAAAPSPPYTGATGYNGGVAFASGPFADPVAFVNTIVLEIIGAGMIPVIAYGADAGYAACLQATPALESAIRNSPLGDLTDYVVKLDGFDSVDSIGLQVNHDNGASETAFIVAFRAAIGNDSVQAHEIWAYAPPIWQFPPNPAWSAIDVFLAEFQGLMLGNTPAPKIVAGTWDSEHKDYAPVFNVPAGQEQPWTLPWQVYRRMLPNYQPTADEPYNIVVPVTGSASDPNFKGTAPVSVDTTGSQGEYTAAGTPRGRQYVSFFEFGTYPATHTGAGADKAQIQTTRAWLASMQPDAIC